MIVTHHECHDMLFITFDKWDIGYKLIDNDAEEESIEETAYTSACHL